MTGGCETAWAKGTVPCAFLKQGLPNRLSLFLSSSKRHATFVRHVKHGEVCFREQRNLTESLAWRLTRQASFSNHPKEGRCPSSGLRSLSDNKGERMLSRENSTSASSPSVKISVNYRYNVGDLAMPSVTKRIETALNPSSYAVIAEAADCLGLTIRGFTAMAAYERAVSVLQSAQAVSQRPQAHFSKSDWEIIEKFLDEHPNWIEEHVSKAREATAGLKFREVAPEDLV